MLVSKLVPWSFQAGDTIMTEGEVGDKLYIIELGVCQAYVDGRDEPVANIGSGAFFGELAVLYDVPRGATIRAATDVTAGSLSRKDLESAVSADKIARMRALAPVPKMARDSATPPRETREPATPPPETGEPS